MARVTVVLDTTAFVDALRKVPAARDLLRGVESRPVASEVTRVEVIRGLRSGERAAAEHFFTLIDWHPVDEPIARLAGDFGRTYRRSHDGIGVADLIVAATAKHLDAKLITSNVKHFPMFPKLKPPY